MERVVSTRDSVGLFRALSGSYPPSFRELDDVFLQTQARIWLGEVLKTRLEEDTSIGDLLADGVLLFSVTQVIWKMLIKKYTKLRYSNAFFRKSASTKNGGKYMPYSNVDSFLKICQILGLTGADLFSPSDVVEKKVTRRVCICIRSLSKKAISKNINVPDFDVVTYTVPISKDMVEGICKSLEQSQRKQSEDSSCSAACHSTIHIYGQKKWGNISARQYDSFSEFSDDTDGDYNEDCNVSLLHSDLDHSPRRSSLATEDLHFVQDIIIRDFHDDDHNELYSGSFSPSPEAKASPNAYHLPNNNQHSPQFSYPIAETLLIGAVRRAVNTLEDETFRTTKPINFFQLSMDDNKSERNLICQPDTSNQDDCGSGSESDESAVYSEHGKKLFEEIEDDDDDDDVSSTVFSHLEQENIADFGDEIPDQLKRVEVPDSSENFAKEETSDEQVGKDGGVSDHKRLRNKLIKSFAGGISVLGVFLLLLNLRRPNDGGKMMDTIMAPEMRIKKKNRSANIFGKNKAEGVYPTGNLKF